MNTRSTAMLSRRNRSVWYISAALGVAAAGVGCGLAMRFLLDRSVDSRPDGELAASKDKLAGVSNNTLRGLQKAACGISLAQIPPEIQVDSTESDYDPTKLLRLGAQASEIFAAEFRNEKWASAMEVGVGGLMQRDLETMIPEAKQFSVECRSRSCLLSWASMGKMADERVWTAIDLAIMFPSLLWQRNGPEGRAGMHLFFRPIKDFPVEEQAAAAKAFDVTDAERYVAVFAARRQRIYASLRTGSRKVPPILQGIRLPH